MKKNIAIYIFIAVILFSTALTVDAESLQEPLQSAEDWVKNTFKDNIVSQKIFLKKLQTIRSIQTSDSEKIKLLQKEFPQVFNTSLAEQLRLAKLLGIIFTSDNKTILNCTNTAITYVIIPDSVTHIGNEAFQKCDKLTHVEIPANVISIGENAFYRCDKLESVTMTDNVRSIGKGAFSWCRSLKSIRLSQTLTELPDDIFYLCESLENIDFPRRMTSVGSGAFSKSGLKHVSLPPTLKEIPASLFGGSKLESVHIPGTVRTIGTNAFASCDNLKKVYLYEGLENIEKSAFSSSQSLSDITIPASVKNIADGAFAGVNKISCSPENKIFMVDKNGALINTDSGHILALSGNFRGVYSIPEGITTIRPYAFTQCFELESVIFPSTLQGLDCYAFCNSGIKYISIPPGITTIREYTFYNCNRLKKVHLPKSVSYFERNAFKNCIRLTDMNLEHVKDILSSAVQNTPYESHYNIYDGISGKYYRHRH